MKNKIDIKKIQEKKHLELERRKLASELDQEVEASLPSSNELDQEPRQVMSRRTSQSHVSVQLKSVSTKPVQKKAKLNLEKDAKIDLVLGRSSSQKVATRQILRSQSTEKSLVKDSQRSGSKQSLGGKQPRAASRYSSRDSQKYRSSSNIPIFKKYEGFSTTNVRKKQIENFEDFKNFKEVRAKKTQGK